MSFQGVIKDQVKGCFDDPGDDPVTGWVERFGGADA